MKQPLFTVSPARKAAFEILRRVESESAYSSALIASLDRTEISRDDRALAQELVLGVLRWRGSLDYFIERYAARAVQSLDLPVTIALRMGLYQLRHLTRIPRSAAVNESVNLVKQARVGSAAGLVNAVLRRAINHLDEPPGERITDPEERASIELSHPRWLLERWQSWLGPGELRALALANNSIPRTCFRVNTLRSTLKGVLASLEDQSVAVRESEIAPEAFVVESGPARAINEAARQGLIYIQDEASQLVSHLLEARPGDRVLDLCAAPGSKSSHIAGLTADDAWIVACDLYTHRLKTLLDNCRRLEVSSVNAVALDATRALPFDRACSFDRVLVDAPCSGTGTLRANPEIKWRLKDEDIARLAKLQLALLTRAASSVAGGGGLVYSTCSLEREENEDIVRAFLENNSEFRVTKPNAPESLTTPDGFVRTYPHRDGCDGFFAAVLEKEE